MTKFLRPRLLLALLLAAQGALAAESLLKPLPQGTLDRLDPTQKSALAAARAQFEQAKGGLVGPPLAEAFARMGALYASYGVDDVAAAAFENAMALQPEDGRYPYLRGYLRLRAQRLPEARADFAASVRLDPDYLPAQYHLGELSLVQGDLGAARKTYQAIATKRPDLAPAWSGLGEVSLREKKYAEAVKHFEQALKVDPRADQLHARLAEALAGAGNGARAAEERAKAGARPALFADPLGGSLEAPVPQGSLVDQANQLIAEGNVDRAAALLDDMLKTNPRDPVALAAYVRLELRRGDPGAAERRADAALRDAPNAAVLLLARGAVYESHGDEAQAQALYSRAVAADVHLREARVALGNSYVRQRRYPQAGEQFRFLLSDVPDDSIALARIVAVESLSLRCQDAERRASAAARERPRDGLAAQIFVRAASSCAATSEAEHAQALDVAKALYKQLPSGEHAEAYAMALAANGRGKEAVDYEAQAIFESTKAQNETLAVGQRAWLKRFEGGQPVERPWPPGHGFIDPPSAHVAPAAAAPAK
jgi:tetratricopeptide (TPR) repeat protein